MHFGAYGRVLCRNHAGRQPPDRKARAQDKPEKTVDRVTTVSVSLEGTDSIGARLGTLSALTRAACSP